MLLILLFFAAVILLLFLPVKGARGYAYTPPSKRVHEADSVLSRRLLSPGSEAYHSYYARHPEFKDPDDKSRHAPGLLSPQSKNHHRTTFAAASANFQVIDFLGKLIQEEPGSDPGPFHPGKKESANKTDPKAKGDNRAEDATRFIAEWLKKTGAHSVGFTALKDHHLYSHKGRGPENGRPVLREHENAIAITVEMDHVMMQSAPLGSSVMESSEQYLRSGVLALKLAAFIREMGYDARAHIDGHYEVICPLVAVDAGLGVIGRMGLLMTPDLGPRVRISVVSTNMPLALSSSQPETSTLQFCDLCKKCAENCPAGAIPTGRQEYMDGTMRWQINSEKCYHFWTLSGTDCGRCMTVCPYSHADNLFHRFIRWGIKNNLVFRYLAVKLDNVFYGRKPSIRALPEWVGTND